jgi:flagellar hook-associated protein 3 FlgL
MALVSLGDMAQTFLMRRHTTEAKAALQRHLTEVSTGQAADLTAQVRGDHSALNGIDASLARLQAYASVTTEMGLIAQSMQTALGTIDDLASGIAPTLLSAASPTNPTIVNATAADAHQRFETVVGLLNARIGDRSLFAGQGTQGPAIADAETILAALEAAITGLTAVSDVETAISDWFDDPMGYAAQAYLGTAPLTPVTIAEGERSQTAITALDPDLKTTLKGLAMAAMVDRGALAGAPVARAELAMRAGQVLISGQTGRTQMAADLGVVEAQISAAATRNTAETSALNIGRAGIVSVDPYEAATRLQDTETQLETLYTLTARLSRLSLVDFLR